MHRGEDPLLATARNVCVGLAHGQREVGISEDFVLAWPDSTGNDSCVWHVSPRTPVLANTHTESGLLALNTPPTLYKPPVGCAPKCAKTNVLCSLCESVSGIQAVVPVCRTSMFEPTERGTGLGILLHGPSKQPCGRLRGTPEGRRLAKGSCSLSALLILASQPLTRMSIG